MADFYTMKSELKIKVDTGEVSNGKAVIKTLTWAVDPAATADDLADVAQGLFLEGIVDGSLNDLLFVTTAMITP
jgi:hypothetical protein